MEEIIKITSNQIISRDQQEAMQSLQSVFADFLRLDIAAGDASPRTIATYLAQIKQYFLWCVEVTRINPACATYDDIKEYRKWLICRGYKRNTISSKLQAVRRLYEAAQAAGLRPDNPAAMIKSPRDNVDSSSNIKYLPVDIVQKLLCRPMEINARTLRNRAIFCMMALQGLRTIEITRITTMDIDGKHMNVKGKGNKVRKVVLAEYTRAALQEWMDMRKTRKNLAQSEYVFVSLNRSSTGKRLSTRGIRSEVDMALRTYGAKNPQISCHSLRHSFATCALAAGANLYTIGRSMGHSNPRTTQIYADILDREKNNPADRVERYIFGQNNKDSEKGKEIPNAQNDN